MFWLVVYGTDSCLFLFWFSYFLPLATLWHIWTLDMRFALPIGVSFSALPIDITFCSTYRGRKLDFLSTLFYLLSWRIFALPIDDAICSTYRVCNFCSIYRWCKFAIFLWFFLIFSILFASRILAEHRTERLAQQCAPRRLLPRIASLKKMG